MFFILLILITLLYLTFHSAPPVGELQFMLPMFMGAAYIAGFIDSRLFLKRDEKNRARELEQLNEGNE